MEGLVFIVFLCLIFLFTKYQPVIISRMDFYFPQNTLFYKKSQIIFAIVLLILGVIGGLVMNRDVKTFIIVEGFIISIYILFIVIYFIGKIKRHFKKAKSIKIPGKIVGITKKRTWNRGAGDHDDSYSTTIKLIIEFVHPTKNEIVEHITDGVTGHPFYSLRDLNVDVYYQNDENILIDGFNRIKKNKENLAYKYTGKVNGKMPEGVLRVDEKH